MDFGAYKPKKCIITTFFHKNMHDQATFCLETNFRPRKDFPSSKRFSVLKVYEIKLTYMYIIMRSGRSLSTCKKEGIGL